MGQIGIIFHFKYQVTFVPSVYQIYYCMANALLFLCSSLYPTWRSKLVLKVTNFFFSRLLPGGSDYLRLIIDILMITQVFQFYNFPVCSAFCYFLHPVIETVLIWDSLCHGMKIGIFPVLSTITFKVTAHSTQQFHQSTEKREPQWGDSAFISPAIITSSCLVNMLLAMTSILPVYLSIVILGGIWQSIHHRFLNLYNTHLFFTQEKDILYQCGRLLFHLSPIHYL